MRISDWSSDVCSSDLATVVDSEFPSYDGDKNGELSQTEFTAWMTTLKKAEIASTGQALGDQEISAWASTAFAMADQDKSKAVSKTEQIGREHVWTPVTNAHFVYRLLLEKKKEI